ncbi:YsaB family lipoprotein [Shimwellia blattae]|uniref:Putative lipoprotein n=1 Tax=Shimwellia blattae (strain ATCC 29907 / DSM 4481 / JCM 1650 / NBRC 105725 / CDC 9005-74) TaxID=630626 RepID=I2B403_SHIBC|nr:YsaB family lipoprotein [Shimwellia blattae]AFJ45257.1 putative lipoprotein [Shimwellia blattae DSM 4481 = NBRC 105725]GAB80630.1 hypothetical protein YsaB [Shimwellia blattae DSM 4481 = NBRC 105725]VDY62735.1 Uncharacterised protein [Shimwellia blattae]VEC19534.1 Uncharacterised protein [Shimwellia blattae]
MDKKRRLAGLVTLVLLGLTGCSHTEEHQQYAQRAHTAPVRQFDMEQSCRDAAAMRYNTRAQQLTISQLERFQGSYEVSGTTRREEHFTCSFDDAGQFLHLSMR